MSWKYTSGRAWACRPRTTNSLAPSAPSDPGSAVAGAWSPGVKPTATRLGTPSDRAKSAKADEDSWQKPRRAVRNACTASGSPEKSTPSS